MDKQDRLVYIRTAVAATCIKIYSGCTPDHKMRTMRAMREGSLDPGPTNVGVGIIQNARIVTRSSLSRLPC